jgi:hypothetical protein
MSTYEESYQKLLNAESMNLDEIYKAAAEAIGREEVGVLHCLRLISQLAFAVEANDPNNGW